MIIGFTGTRQGMTSGQRKTLIEMFGLYQPDETHDGACRGSDIQFNLIAQYFEVPVRIAHPADSSVRDYDRCLDQGSYTRVMIERPPLIRNHDIVDASEMMIACPKEMNEVLRSGTWAAIRYARKVGKQVFLIWPNGRIERN